MVSTVMDGPSTAGHDWSRPAELLIGRALLLAARDVLTAAELADATGRNPSNLKKVADEMVDTGLLTRETPTVDANRRGRRPRSAYALGPGARTALERHLAQTIEPGRLGPGQQLVFAEFADPGIEDLLHVISNSGAAGQATWSALCDGDRQEYVIAFDGDGSDRLAVDLMAALSAAKIRVRRTSVSQVRPMSEMLEQARRALRAAERSRLRQRTRRAGAA
jgi:DNA-binding MarR family transcriptional regulator